MRSDKEEGHHHHHLHHSVTDKTMTSKCRQNVVDVNNDVDNEESEKISKMMLQNKQLLVRQNVLSTNDLCEECIDNDYNVEISTSTKRIFVPTTSNSRIANTSAKKKVRKEGKCRHRKVFFCRLNFVILIVVIPMLFCQMSSFVSCQTSFDGSDVNVERETDDNFDDDKLLSTNSRENGGHSFSSSPYPHQVFCHLKHFKYFQYFETFLLKGSFTNEAAQFLGF